VRIRWLRLARNDLHHVRGYIAQDHPSAAEIVSRRILRAVETLAEFPERGRLERVSGTRELVVPRTPFIVAYRWQADTIEIIRVIHGARRWPTL
jgi:toxin ParE1/3/4